LTRRVKRSAGPDADADEVGNADAKHAKNAMIAKGQRFFLGFFASFAFAFKGIRIRGGAELSPAW